MAIDDPAAVSLGRLQDLLGFQLRMASAAMARDFARAMDELELTQKQYAVLELVAANPGLSQIDIAAALDADRATIMALVDRLEVRGLLLRERSVRDRRRQELALTPAARTALALARRRIAAHERTFIARLGGDAEGVMALLRRLYA